MGVENRQCVVVYLCGRRRPASVARVGRSSMTVAVDMIREDRIRGRRKSAVRGTFEMVAVNELGRPVPIAEPAAGEIKEETTP
jgi:acyl-CoA hydrolase